jgi:hypothetical protein
MEKDKQINLLKQLIDKGLTFLSKTEDKPKEVTLSAEATKSDGTIVYTEADEFAVGVGAFVKEGEQVLPAPDGEHTLEDGTILIVADGVVESITSPEEEVAEEGETVSRSEFSELKDSIGKSFQELFDIMKMSSDVQAELSKQFETTKSKSVELNAQIEKLQAEKAELDAILSATPKSDKAKVKSTREVPNISKTELGKMRQEERTKLLIEYPELLNKN